MPGETIKQSTQSNQWETVSEVEFAGRKVLENTEDSASDSEKDTIQDNIEEIRAIIDTKTIAQREDPEGLAEAQKKDQSILESCALQRRELEDRVAEYKALSKEESEYHNNGEYMRLQTAKQSREKSRAHKTLTFFHRPDKILDGINAELANKEDRFSRVRELVSGGYSDDQSIETTIKSIDGLAETATNEEEFLSGFERPLSREQKDKLLDYDTLAELSTEEYLKLWRHLNPQYVSHITRQGYRDHSTLAYHSDGVGEMTRGFTSALESGKRLQSSISLSTGMTKSELLDDKEALLSYMEKVYFKDGVPKSLLESENLSPNLIASVMGGGHGISASPKGYWRDSTAIHVGANNVLESQYGAESGNEVFYVFPADVVMSQSSVNRGLLHSGAWTADFEDPELTNRIIETGGQRRVIPYTVSADYNDTSVYAQDGLPLDAGLVFLPKSVLVDPRTGSKYQSFDSETKTGVVMTEEMGGVTAEEYWEGYFKEHPEEKPAHIIYYDGDPETAVAETLAKNGIYVGNHGDTSGETGSNLGFDDKILSDGTELDTQLKEEAERFFAAAADYIRSKRDERSE